jgi:hypothetical protein
MNLYRQHNQVTAVEARRQKWIAALNLRERTGQPSAYLAFASRKGVPNKWTEKESFTRVYADRLESSHADDHISWYDDLNAPSPEGSRFAYRRWYVWHPYAVLEQPAIDTVFDGRLWHYAVRKSWYSTMTCMHVCMTRWPDEQAPPYPLEYVEYAGEWVKEGDPR